jgi:hypothetical protein
MAVKRVEIGRDLFGIEHFGCKRQTLIRRAPRSEFANELHYLVLLFSADLGEHWQ